jgi:hypothetical protein
MVKCNQVDESCYVVRSYMMVRRIVCDVIWCAWLVKRCVVNSEPAVLLQCNLGPGPQPLNSKKNQPTNEEYAPSLSPNSFTYIVQTLDSCMLSFLYLDFQIHHSTTPY